jgi:hypothetical protein
MKLHVEENVGYGEECCCCSAQTTEKKVKGQLGFSHFGFYFLILDILPVQRTGHICDINEL